MKRLYTTPEYKRRNTRVASRSLRKQILFKLNKKEKNRRRTGRKKKQTNKKENFFEKFHDYAFITAPEYLSFIENPVVVADFISKLELNYNYQRKVFVVLANVKKITYDAIVVLLSIMFKFKSSDILFNGDFPSDPVCRRILEESLFVKYLFKNIKDEERYEIGQRSSIHTHAFKNVDSVLASKLIENASKTIWGETRRCQGVQRTLIELMLNTNNHADDSKKGEKHWWLSINHDSTNKKVGFAFIDFGVGIFTSLNNKRQESKFYGIIEKVKERWKYGNNSDLLRLILDGTLHKTATNKPYHGKGLPGINKARERNQISNLNIITNDVHAKVDANEFNILPKSFSGTFVYWEVHQENINCHAADQN